MFQCFFQIVPIIDKQPFVKYIYFILFGDVTQCLQTKVSSIQVMRLKEVKKENKRITQQVGSMRSFLNINDRLDMNQQRA